MVAQFVGKSAAAKLQGISILLQEETNDHAVLWKPLGPVADERDCCKKRGECKYFVQSNC